MTAEKQKPQAGDGLEGGNRRLLLQRSNAQGRHLEIGQPRKELLRESARWSLRWVRM